MMPLAADLAPPSRRAQSMAIVLSGLMLGLLVARVLGGVIAEFTSFRDVYWMSVGAQAVTGILLYWTLPDYPAKMPDLKYWKIHLTMVKFLFTNPTLSKGDTCISRCYTDTVHLVNSTRRSFGNDCFRQPTW